MTGASGSGRKLSDSAVLLVSPPFTSFYRSVPIREGVPYSPTLSLPTVAAGLIRRGIRVRILDGNLYADPLAAVRDAVRQDEPDWVGVSVVTPLWNEALAIVKAVRETRARTRIVLGGPHVSALPRESLQESGADAVVIGEGDETLADLVEAGEDAAVPGAAVRLAGGEISFGSHRPEIADLDTLPLPAWELYDLRRYHTTRLLSRRSPAGWIETSRGCPFGCVYCSKHTFGRGFRAKSPGRVVDEMAAMLARGFKEIHIADDCFSFKPDRVRGICEEILRRDLRFPWAPVTGIRVDNLDGELLRLMRRAGCYRVYLGIESGSDEILKRVNKGITLEKVRRAVRASREAGLETFGFFMIALPGETEETMRQTRRFARELDLDMAKISITIPLPGTPLYREIEQDGRLLTRHWSEYNLYRPARTVYRHDTLDWDVIEKHYRLFYRSFYLRPGYALRRLRYALRNRTLLTDLRALFQTDW